MFMARPQIMFKFPPPARAPRHLKPRKSASRRAVGADHLVRAAVGPGAWESGRSDRDGGRHGGPGEPPPWGPS